MTIFDMSLDSFFGRNERTVQVELKNVRGSSPRNSGTIMYVAAHDLWGTIGGGQLEYMVVERAREMLTDGVLADNLNIPLGPEIGQCCGGRVDVSLARMSRRDRLNASERAQLTEEAYPHVYVMGAGHVGRALAEQLQFLPVHCVLVDTREEELEKCTAEVETRLSIIPEFVIRNAPEGSAYVVLTHDHALDFLLTSEALERDDARYVGMIGSATKRAKFANWCREMCNDLTIEDLNCPIGASGSRDKRPSVIAAFVAAEIIAELTSEPAAQAPSKGTDLQRGKPSSGWKQASIKQQCLVSHPTGGGGTHYDHPKLLI